MPAGDAAYQRAWRRNNPERTKRHKRASACKRYGLTLQGWDHLFASQDQRCAACRADEHGGRNWHVDHCHLTGRVRGILCHRCNVALGMLEDSPERVLSLHEYVTKALS
jgi:hypothetical protein